MACNMFNVTAQPSLQIPSMRIDNSQVKMSVLVNLRLVLIGKNPIYSRSSKVFCHAASLEEEFSAIQSKKSPKNLSKDEEIATDTLVEEKVEAVPPSEELKALIVDSQRTTLLNKLSEANQQNRFLKRQLEVKENALGQFKNELGVIEHEIEALVGLTQEMAKSDILEASRKMNELLSRLGGVQKKLVEQIKGVDAAHLKEIKLFWRGMATNVNVLGSFNGWSQAQHLSPENTNVETTFSTSLMLRPGRYEIKFMVDGEWQLSPEFATVGEGVMENNLLIVQ